MIKSLTQQSEENDKFQWGVGMVRNMGCIILILKPLWEDTTLRRRLPEQEP
jgi:hypothetical protein